LPDGLEENIFVKWKDFSNIICDINRDLAGLKVWQKVILTLLSANTIINTTQVVWLYLTSR